MLPATAELFSKIHITSQKCSIDLKSVFNTRGTIINIFGRSIRNSQKNPPKSVLLHKLEKDVEIVTETLKDSISVADGMATVRELKHLKSTYSKLAVRELNMLCQMEVDQKELMLLKQWVSNSVYLDINFS